MVVLVPHVEPPQPLLQALLVRLELSEVFVELVLVRDCGLVERVELLGEEGFGQEEGQREKGGKETRWERGRTFPSGGIVLRAQ